MNDTPPDKTGRQADVVPLNPSLKQVYDPSYGADQQGRDPMDSVSVRGGGGTAWPLIWMATTLLCIAITVWLLFF